MLTIAIVAGAVAAPILGASIVASENADTQLAVTCASAQSNRTQLEALRAFSHRLGVPWVYPIPEMPPECDDF